MSRHADAQAKTELALRQVLTTQSSLLTLRSSDELFEILKQLNDLALQTSTLIRDGSFKLAAIKRLAKSAKQIEDRADCFSEQIWERIHVDISVYFERISWAFTPETGEAGVWSDVRAHYNNQRVALLQQSYGARMLDSNSDLGDEIERILQHYLQHQLGASFSVLRGGKIRDQRGGKSSQIDIIVVPSDAQIMTPSNAKDGKSHVFVDQVISAIMVGSTISKKKLREDWTALQSIPEFQGFSAEYPEIRGDRWPLCYIAGAQSDPLKQHVESWVKLCKEGLVKRVPEFLIALDSGFLTSQARSWPGPSPNVRARDPGQVSLKDMEFSGLGLAWMLIQQKGRLAVIRRQNVTSIKREIELLDNASKRSVKDTFSPRHHWGELYRPLSGALCWGGELQMPHNRLRLQSVSLEGVESIGVTAPLGPGDNPRYPKSRLFNVDRWHSAGNFVALEEWFDIFSPENIKKKIVVFDSEAGREVTSEVVDGLKEVNDLDLILSRLKSGAEP